MAMRPRTSRSKMPLEISPIVYLWILRLLIPLGGHREFISKHGFNNDSIAEILNLGDWISCELDDFNPKPVMTELRKLYRDGDRKLRNASVPSCLRKNVERLSALVGLSDTDCRILEFAVLIKNERLLDEAADWLGQLSSIKVFYNLAVLLNLPEQEIRSALSMQGILTRSGLVSIDHNGLSSLSLKLNLLSDNFADHIFSSDADPVNLLRDTVTLSSPAELKISDYVHLTTSLNVLRPYLKHSVSSGRKGVNVFLHGKPGTGKSQLVKALAKELDCELFEVASEDCYGDSVNGEHRLRAFRAAQSFFAQRRAIILFDEVEDVFNDGDSLFGNKSTAQKRKAWINRTLEENSVPTFWLSNSIGNLDPAFIRRFDMVIELPVPPKNQRQQIIKDTCSDLLDAHGIARIAETEYLSPAVVTRAASVVRSIHEELGKIGTATAVELLICNTLEAQGHKPIRKNDPTRLPEVYDPEFIRADIDLTQVAEGLVQSRSGRLCLYGPPGTGKTAFARWMSQKLDVPLHIKRGSDLISMWVGGTEKNLARAFRQADQDSAILLIDEVDSFLQDRRGAQQSWEVTGVNEMLTQMESFSGIFIASTNLMKDLDQAALRRFDIKVRFDFLKPEQAWELLRRHCVELKVDEPEEGLRRRIERLGNLTPGDFAAVIRQSRFRPITSTCALVEALEAECALKEGAKSAIGFL